MDGKINTTHKKKPGRPRKTPLKKPLKRNGISDTPLNEENCMEMVYDNPSLFKRIFMLFKCMSVKELCMSFEHKIIEISTRDHLKKSNIKTVIDCKNINHYYCKDPVRINLNPNNIEKVIQVLDKNYTTVAFTLKTTTSRSFLNVIFKNDLHIDEYREIDLIQTSTHISNVSFDDSNYAVKFKLPGKYFKKFVNDINTFSDTLTINKIGLSPLTFSYTSKDKTVKSKHVVKDPSVIELKSAVADDEIFSSSVQIDYIKPLSGSLLSDYIYISADTHKNMIFKINVDNQDSRSKEFTINILISTDTVNLKNI